MRVTHEQVNDGSIGGLLTKPVLNARKRQSLRIILGSLTQLPNDNLMHDHSDTEGAQ